MSILKILAELCSKPTCSVPFAGLVLGELGKNSSYDAAIKGTLGVPVIDTGGKKRVPSIAVLRRLGFDDDALVAAIVEQDKAPAAAEVAEASSPLKVAASVAKTAAVKTAKPKRRRSARSTSTNKAA